MSLAVRAPVPNLDWNFPCTPVEPRQASPQPGQDLEGQLLRRLGKIEASLASLDEHVRLHLPRLAAPAAGGRLRLGAERANLGSSEASQAPSPVDAEAEDECSDTVQDFLPERSVSPSKKVAWQTGDHQGSGSTVDPTRVMSNLSTVSNAATERSWNNIIPSHPSNRNLVVSQVVDDSSKERIAWGTRSEGRSNSKLMKRISTSLKLHTDLKVQEESAMYKLVHSHQFSFVCAVVIVVNSMFIGYTASEALEAEMAGLAAPTWTQVTEGIFVAFFVLELLARFVGEQGLFFTGREWKWNMFDTVLVCLSVVDVVVSSQDRIDHNFSSGRLLRLIRFFRLARLTRVIRLFANLRLVLFSILDSMSSLFWCFTVIGLMLYVFSILFMNVACVHFHSVGLNPTDKTSQDMKRFFGDLYASMVTLFMVITGGVDWFEVSDPLINVHPVYGIMLFFYVFMMQFGILNVVVGTFVASAQEIASKDREALVRFELRQHEVSTARIRDFFEEADIDKSGTLSWAEFEQHLQTDKMKAYFQAMELDVSMARELFELLDVSGEDQVTIDDFLQGCMRLKGHARSQELNMLVHMCKKVFKEMMHFMDWSEVKLDSLQQQILTLRPGS